MRKFLQVLAFILLGVLTVPIQKIMQHLGAAEKLITQASMDHIKMIARPGDILLSHERQRLTSIFIKGFWDHAAIVTSRGTVMEAVGSGVKEVLLSKWLSTKDYVRILRPEYPHPKMGPCAGSRALLFAGYRYNFSFSDWNPFRWERKIRGVYCSQLVFKSHRSANHKFMMWVKKKTKLLPIAFLEHPTLYCSKDTPLPDLIEDRPVPKDFSG